MKTIRPLGIFAVFCAFITLLLGVSLAGLIIGFLRQDLMAFGLTFAGHPLSGLTKEEAQREVAQYVTEKLISPAVILAYGDQRWEAAPDDIGLVADIPATVEHAFSVGREGPFWRRGKEVLLCALGQREIPLAVRVDKAQFQRYLVPVAASLHQTPKDAACTVGKDGAVLHQKGVSGVVLDTEALVDTITPALHALRLPQRVALEPAIEAPAVTAEDLAAVDAVLGVYTTYYTSASNRGENIEIAAASLNRRLIRSGAAFSFNEVVGKRVPSAGYLTAPVIVDGKVEQDFGGGVCQVSSTLYNAILLANLTPTQRVPHFYPSTYVPAGLDATVADGQIDFCFENRLPHNVYLLTEAGDDTLTIRVLGCRADVPGEIYMETAVVGPNPTVDSYRVYERDGVEIHREFLYTDEYDIPPPDPAAANPPTGAPPAVGAAPSGAAAPAKPASSPNSPAGSPASPNPAPSAPGNAPSAPPALRDNAPAPEASPAKRPAEPSLRQTPAA